METFMDMGNHIIGLGGQPWVSELLKLVRESPTHVFDRVLTTPLMVAHILGDEAATFLDIAYYRWGVMKEGTFNTYGMKHL